MELGKEENPENFADVIYGRPFLSLDKFLEAVNNIFHFIFTNLLDFLILKISLIGLTD